ncbi:type I DNA topoisomerase [Desulfolutivibrio sulfoxidireducens]|uniref:type I DNA topoisomerase n=1 Tax=Desulfolutivibrio sulfoxidireducens TaxID=2773299 RepID=UPI00159E61AD|nr:type I DNA topoisomerase [Desulfolutivibrio sulfoxidireducens]QLA18319.1 type I DNA topoisomerase [Desulfolutivibrio sulfoxidireducens]
MAKELIIVESPAKVKTIKKFLGNAYAVEASVGHVRDLPTSSLGVDEKKNFAPQYQIIQGKQKVVTRLREAAAKAKRIYLAPDPDREGEAIAWHVAELLKDGDRPIHRIFFNEITAKAVREALKNPREIDEKLFLSQQARRILDRLVGYKVSPLLWKKVKRGISAGRVQSVALKLVVEREKERQAFVPEEYWVFKALLAAAEPPVFEAELWKVAGKKPVIGDAETASALRAEILESPFAVAAMVEKERAKSPPPPYITSTLQQAANQRLGFSAKRTMGAAQRLYEGVELGERGTVALITYMRTDSVRIADEARQAAREFIVDTLGPEFYPDKPRFFKTKASAQDAHEAIRPVDPAVTPDDVRASLPREQYALYKLIWERFLASQMAEARFWDTTAEIKAGRALFRAKGQRLIFPGYLKVYGMEAGDEAKTLPPLAKGQSLTLAELKTDQKFTQPPPRYTEASLVRELEEKGIGRPSTYAAIISTLIDREYARLEEKHFVPSELGTTVSDLLSDHFATIMDVGFTAGMEAALDEVAEGQRDWVALLTDFTGGFYPALEKAAEDMAAVKAGKETGLVCEKCGKPMVIKFGRMGEFLACSGYPDCKNTSNFVRTPDGGIELVARQVDEPVVVGKCPECGKDLVLKKSRTGSRFVACTGYPACKHAEPFRTGVACPREGCGGELVEKSSKRGKIFYSCDQYPQCDYAVWDWPVAEPCPKCGSKILVKKRTQAKGEHLACPEKSCRYTRSLDGNDPEDTE